MLPEENYTLDHDHDQKHLLSAFQPPCKSAVKVGGMVLRPHIIPVSHQSCGDEVFIINSEMVAWMLHTDRVDAKLLIQAVSRKTTVSV